MSWAHVVFVGYAHWRQILKWTRVRAQNPPSHASHGPWFPHIRDLTTKEHTRPQTRKCLFAGSKWRPPFLVNQSISHQRARPETSCNTKWGTGHHTLRPHVLLPPTWGHQISTTWVLWPSEKDKMCSIWDFWKIRQKYKASRKSCLRTPSSRTYTMSWLCTWSFVCGYRFQSSLLLHSVLTIWRTS